MTGQVQHDELAQTANRFIESRNVTPGQEIVVEQDHEKAT